MRVGIITIYDEANYGNRLQNYAVQKILEERGFQVETIKNRVQESKPKYTIKLIYERIIEKIKTSRHKEKKIKRVERFKVFNKEYIKTADFSIMPNDIKDDLNNEYDFFIVGSDQVWNPNWRLSDIDLLSFAESKKRIAFSASFGVEEIPEDKKERVAKELNKFKAISVREDKGKEIVENLTKREDIEVIVDPTMLLTTEQWDELIKKPEQVSKKKYILVYFLGVMSKKVKKEINRIAKENDCEILSVFDRENKIYGIDPGEFLYLEKNAFLVCTDSFHSTIFSILYDVPFLVFGRNDGVSKMNSRIDTLLNKFCLQDRKYKGEIPNYISKHDYSQSYKILEDERKKAFNFLDKALLTKD